MSHEEKVALLLNDLSSRGVSRLTAAPPLFRLAWRWGLRIPPPHFLSFGVLAWSSGSFFGIVWGALMWALFWSAQGMPARLAVVAALLAGGLFGLTMATYYRWQARKHGLTSWVEYGGGLSR